MSTIDRLGNGHKMVNKWRRVDIKKVALIGNSTDLADRLEAVFDEDEDYLFLSL